MPNLRIRLRQAKNLTAKDISKTSDPLVICTVNSKKSFKTEPIMMDCNPNWETLKKPIKNEFIVNFDKMTDVVLLQVEDYNIFSKNKPIGSCQIPLQFLENSKPMEFTFDIRDVRGSVAGQLIVLLEAMDFGLASYATMPVQPVMPSIMPSTTTGSSMTVYPPSQPISPQPPYNTQHNLVVQPPPLTSQPISPQTMIVGNLQRNGSSPTMNTLRNGSFLTNNNNNNGVQSPSTGLGMMPQQQQQPLQSSQSFIMSKTPTSDQSSVMVSSQLTTTTGASSGYGMPQSMGGSSPSVNVYIGNNNNNINNTGMQQQQTSLTHSNSFISNYPPQPQPIQQQMYNNSTIPPNNINNNNNMMQYPQQPHQQQLYNHQGIVNSPIGNGSSPNLQLMMNNSSFNSMNNSQTQQQQGISSQQNDNNSVPSTPRKALPSIPGKQTSTSPQTIGQPNVDSQIPKPNELSQTNQSVQWTGVVTDQYIDYVISQLPIPLSIPEYYERFVKPFKI